MINENPQTATNQEQEMNRKCNCEHWQQCATCKPKVATTTPHKHAAMIKEWADDTSRVVEYQQEDDEWYKFTDVIYDEVERFEESCDWRFADQVTRLLKPEIVSSLSDLLLREIFISYAYPSNPAERADDLRGIRAIANAAAKKAHAEGYQAAINAVCALPSDTGLNKTQKQYSLSPLVIREFQADVKKLLGGV